MDWATAAALALNYGLPFVERIIANIENGVALTSQTWQDAKALVATPENALESVAKLAGLAMDDPKITALAQLIAAAK